jgi:hypothetical protein
MVSIQNLPACDISVCFPWLAVESILTIQLRSSHNFGSQTIFRISVHQKGGHFRTPFPWRRHHIEIGSIFDIHYVHRFEFSERERPE